MRRNATPEQQAAAEARRHAFRELAAKISAMSDPERAAMAARLPAIATIKGRTLSPFNVCLIASQCPSATIVGGFRQWLKAGRCVKKGEHGLSLWIPTTKKTDDGAEGDSETRFIMGTVFDVAQTQETRISAELAEQRHFDADTARQAQPQHREPRADYYSEEFTPTA